jgi:formylglycine-generating enzyme required for sulfatase activity
MARPGLTPLTAALTLLSVLTIACSKRADSLKPLEPGKPWKNTLGMEFVPVSGTTVLFSVYETRVREFEPFQTETNLDWIGADVEQTPDHPIANVTWDDANAFCAWLTHRERVRRALAPTQRYRLPTDAEWSLASGVVGEVGDTPRAKSESTPVRYVWGTNWPPPNGAGNFSGEESGADRGEDRTFVQGYRDKFPRLAPVGQFTATSSGLHDLAGNIMEWCDDWFDATHRGRVVRGGSWLSGDARTLATTHRAEIPPRAGLDVTGFRCVLEVGR